MINKKKSLERGFILPKLDSKNNDLSKRWAVYYSFKDPETGKMVRFRYTKEINKRDTVEGRREYAKYIVKWLRKKIISGWNPFLEQEQVVYKDQMAYRGSNGDVSNGIRTLNYHVNQYLKNKNCRPATYTSYKSKFRYFQKYAKGINRGRVHLYDISKEDADNFIIYLREKRGLTNKTINDYVILMKAFYKYGVERGLCTYNVFSHMKKLPEETKKPRIYNKEMMKDLVDAMKKHDPQLYMAVQLMFNCFIRPGELRALKVVDIDFTRGVIRVPANVSKVRKQRVVVVPDHLNRKLMEQIKGQYPDEYYLISKDGVPGPKYVGRNFLYYSFVAIKKKLGVSKEYILYAWKHTGMVELKRSGADWLTIRNQAGHKSLDQTIAYTTELMGDTDEYIKTNSPEL